MMVNPSKAKSSKAQARAAGSQSNARPRNRFFAFFDTTLGHGLLVVASLYLVYIFANWARVGGGFLDWSITILLIIIAARETAAFVRGVLNSSTLRLGVSGSRSASLRNSERASKAPRAKRGQAARPPQKKAS